MSVLDGLKLLKDLINGQVLVVFVPGKEHSVQSAQAKLKLKEKFVYQG